MPALSNPPTDAHIAACGLFCSNCGSFKKGRCPGCQVKARFAGCPVRSCVEARKLTTCAPCPDFRAPRSFRECPKVNNWISRTIGFFTKTDRGASLERLRDGGESAYLNDKRSTGRM